LDELLGRSFGRKAEVTQLNSGDLLSRSHYQSEKPLVQTGGFFVVLAVIYTLKPPIRKPVRLENRRRLGINLPNAPMREKSTPTTPKTPAEA